MIFWWNKKKEAYEPVIPKQPELVTLFRVVETQTDVNPKTAIIEIKLKDNKNYYSYVKQELNTGYVRANLTKGFLTGGGYKNRYTYRDHDGNYQDMVKYYVVPINELIETHMYNATASQDHMAHFVDAKGFRFQLDLADIRHIKVKRVIESKDTLPTVDFTLEELKEGDEK